MNKHFTNFSFHMQTDIRFGAGVEESVGEMIRLYGGHRVLLVYGGGSVQRTGLYDRVYAALQRASLTIIPFGGAKANPVRSHAQDGIALARHGHVDFVFAVGGGSVIDTAKAIAAGVVNGGDFWCFCTGEKQAQAALPIGVVHTIAAAGSETSADCVIVDDIDTDYKCYFDSPTIRPTFALMNPALTYTVPPLQKAAGAADVLAHTFDRYFTDADSFLGDQYAEGTMRTVIKYGPIAVHHPNDYESHAELMLAGSFSHNDVTGIGRNGLRGNTHALEERALSGLYDTPHGAGLALIMPSYLQYLAESGNDLQSGRAAQFAVNVMGIPNDFKDVRATASLGAQQLRAWTLALGLPQTLRALGIPASDLDRLVSYVPFESDGTQHRFAQLNRSDVRTIFTRIF